MAATRVYAAWKGYDKAYCKLDTRVTLMLSRPHLFRDQFGHQIVDNACQIEVKLVYRLCIRIDLSLFEACLH